MGILKNIHIFISFLTLKAITMLKRIWNLYYDGFRHLPRWARIVCVIVIAKLLIMFIVFKFSLMPNYLNTHYTTDQEKSNHVFKELTTKS